MTLAGAGIDYVAAPLREGRDRDGAELFVAASPAGVRLSIVAPQLRRNRPRRDDDRRLDTAAVEALLAAPDD